MHPSVVIRTPYVHSGTTYAAIQLADTLRRLGMRVRMRVLGRHRQAVSWYWDTRATWETGQPEKTAAEIWFKCPGRDLWNAVTQPGCRRIIVHVPDCQWDREVYKQAKLIVCASEFAVRRMEENRIGSAKIVWDAPGEALHDTPRPGPARLFVSLDGDQARQVTCDFLEELLRLCDELPALQVTLDPPVTAVRIQAKRWFRTVAAKLGANRCQILPRDDAFVRAAAIASSALCLVPVRCDTFGLGVASAHLLGTPAIAWDISPFRDLNKRFTDLLVGTPVDQTHGTHFACGAWSSMLRNTRDWLLRPDALQELRSPLQAAAESRRRNFFMFWQTVMEDFL
jgi:hypothetical protein